MPTKRTPKRRAHTAPLKITPHIVALYRTLVEEFRDLQDRDDPFSDEYMSASIALNACFAGAFGTVTIDDTFGRDEPPDFENWPEQWWRAHAIRLQLDKELASAGT